MKTVRFAALGLAMSLFLVAWATGADDEKEKTLKGTICCGKCELKVDKACATVIQVKDGDKTITYYFDADSHKKNHKAICTEAKKGTVVGTVSEKDKKHFVKVKEVKFD